MKPKTKKPSTLTKKPKLSKKALTLLVNYANANGRMVISVNSFDAAIESAATANNLALAALQTHMLKQEQEIKRLRLKVKLRDKPTI